MSKKTNAISKVLKSEKSPKKSKVDGPLKFKPATYI
jgi:hypothetical protein